MNKVLVIGDDLRSFLAIVRSLGRKNICVHAAPFDHGSPALQSKFIDGIHYLPPYSLSADKWVAAMQALETAHKFDLIIPCDDRSLLPLYAHRDQFKAILAVPNDAAMAIFFDKVKTRALATECNIPIAVGGPATDSSAAQLGFPLALKPRASMTLAAVGRRATVRIIRSKGLWDYARTHLNQPDDYFLESFFKGHGVGISVIARNGEIVQAFQHRRLQEASESGGSSSRVSEQLDPLLLSAASILCAKSGLHGVAMFELRYNNENGSFILLEVNARFWGSLPLAIASGVDFPSELYALLTGAPLASQSDYRIGVIRHDFTGEYYRILLHSERAENLIKRAFLAGRGLGMLALQAIALPTRFDSYARDDEAPWQGERARIIRAITAGISNRLPDRSRSRMKNARKRLEDLLVAHRQVSQQPPHLIMICYGNICRSPFAAQLLASHIGDKAVVSSAGTLLNEDRTSPADAINIAQNYNIDLVVHRSHFIDIQAATDATALFIFDDQNAAALARLGVDTKKVIRLGDLIGLRAIHDPYGRGPEAFETCYSQIIGAVCEIVAILGKP